jgi:16S rRNA (uracil1498-N3)-methyltransferase
MQGDLLHVSGGDVNHIKNVLRLKPGDEISVRTGQDEREYRYGIEAFTDSEVICRLRFVKEADVELPVKVYLFQGLPKADKMDLIVQKAV